MYVKCPWGLFPLSKSARERKNGPKVLLGFLFPGSTFLFVFFPFFLFPFFFFAFVVFYRYQEKVGI